MKYLKNTLLLTVLLSLGCSTSTEVYAIRQWEGHFYNTNDFYKATGNVVLKDGESIWVLSDKTLLKTLENAKK